MTEGRAWGVARVLLWIGFVLGAFGADDGHTRVVCAVFAVGMSLGEGIRSLSGQLNILLTRIPSANGKVVE